MGDLLEEVLRDAKEERKLFYFKKALPVIIGVSAFAALSMALFDYFLGKKALENSSLGDSFLETIFPKDEAKNEKTIKGLAESEKNSGVKDLASLRLVSYLTKKKEYKEARTGLEKIIENTGYSEITKAYARLLWVSLVLDSDSLKDEENKIMGHLSYFKDRDGLFYGEASAARLAFYLKLGKKSEAKKLMEEIGSRKNFADITKELVRALENYK